MAAHKVEQERGFPAGNGRSHRWAQGRRYQKTAWRMLVQSDWASLMSSRRRGQRLLRLSAALSLAVFCFFSVLSFGYLSRPAAARVLIPLPPILFPNTGVLLASSLALWNAGRDLAAERVRSMLRWLVIALGLGCVFVGGQILAWREWWQAGVFLKDAPASRFFYVLTAAHAAHIAAGLVAIAAVFSLAWRGRLRADAPAPLRAASLFWHCLGLTWIWIYFMLWRF